MPGLLLRNPDKLEIYMSNVQDARPLIPESSASESTNINTVLEDIKNDKVIIPDYQRDSGQWSDTMKSLLVESVINNLSIPAFFFESIIENGISRSDVIDGQQRLTTLEDYFNGKFCLVDSDDAPYISPNSIHYAGKHFSDLPKVYQDAFRSYRLTIIKLRDLGGMRLEIFRRINQGGTPLSGQDIRLAYYGDKSPTLAFIRLVGIYDPSRKAARRFIANAKTSFGLDNPWTDQSVWTDWWEDKDIARGQTASEAFLWSLVSAEHDKLHHILQNSAALSKINVVYNGGIDEALDAFCAQLHWQDTNSSIPSALMSIDEMKGAFFPHFEDWINVLVGVKGVSIPVTKHRITSAIIGAAYRCKVARRAITAEQWTNIVEFLRRPTLSDSLGFEWPQSKGRWVGAKGYQAQMQAASTAIVHLTR
jgi:hypothetical protein